MKDNKDAIGASTFSEIKSQGDSWEGTIRRIDDKAGPLGEIYSEADEIVFAGCGSAVNISNSVAPFFQRLSGKTCRAVHASDVMIKTESFLNTSRKSLAVVYSRSGDTTESVSAVARAKEAGAATIAITCSGQSKMARMADEALVLAEAVEESVTTTRSLTAMILAGYYLAGTCTGNEAVCKDLRTLPDLVRAKMDMFHEIGKKIGSEKGITKYAFLGSGTYYGLAREAQLKIKEMVLLPSDSYVSLDYQHGPMSNVDEGMLVTILVSDAGRSYDVELAGKMKSLGGKVLVICDKAGDEFGDRADYLVELNTGLADGLRDVLYMPALQFMAYYKSLAVGCDPDNPKNLYYHVELGTGA